MPGVNNKYNGLEIAIIGIAGRFPGSSDHREFWKNLTAGRELLKTFTEEELEKSGVPADLLHHPAYVSTMGVLENKGHFDRGFFGYSSEEATLMDPQIRLFHECCWMALEDAGYAASTESCKIGLVAAASANDNWKASHYGRAANGSIDPLYLNMLLSQNFTGSLVAYKHNLKGPVYYIDTACSSSLVAVHMACRSLLTRESDIMMAGGISLKTQKRKGYIYKEGMIRSADGHCRAFDADASGTASGEGVGMVVLKKLSDAINDRDHIYAIIKGSATNNDGNLKVGFTAPGVHGQSECIRRAQKSAQVDPRSIGYVEAHGTGTKLGDPIEIKALNEAFATGGTEKYCAVGSVKTNIGHLDAAAGVTGLIKASLCLKYRQIPPSLNYIQPNPEIDFESGPFYVNTSLKTWQNIPGQPLRAAVSSFGMGGTNAHAILEEAPEILPEKDTGSYKTLTLSAKTEASLERYMTKLHKFLTEEENINGNDMAYTFQTGRKHFQFRKSFIYQHPQELLKKLEQASSERRFTKSTAFNSALVFMFPGQGSQYINMALGLYQNHPVFKQWMDQGFLFLEQLTGTCYKSIIFPCEGSPGLIHQTRYTQPLVFLTEYALAQVLLSAGIISRYMIGHSIGEYVCACLNGVFTFEDALRLVVKRGELMYRLPEGTMISAAMDETAAKKYLDQHISLAAVNAPQQVVFSGNAQAINMLLERLTGEGVPAIQLHTSHAFHSAMMDPVLEEFRILAEQVVFNKNIEPGFISGLTGKIIDRETACSPDYWVRHLRNCIRFADGIKSLLELNNNTVFLEVGCGRALSNMLRQILPAERLRGTAIFNLVRSFKEEHDDMQYLAVQTGKMWEAGIAVNWKASHQHAPWKRVSLPAYSFEPVEYPFETDAFDLKYGIHEERNVEASESVAAELSSYRETTNTHIQRPELSSSYNKPVTETEKVLVRMLEDFFGIQQIGIEDNFFELGGDSLKAMTLIQQIKNRFGLTFTLKDLFNYTDIKQIAGMIDERIWLNRQSDKEFSTII